MGSPIGDEHPPATAGGTDFIPVQMSPTPTVLVFDTPEQVARAAAGRFVGYSAASIADHGSFTVALAGGSTPRRTYELLGSDEFKNRVDWAVVQLFFGDERMVSPDSPESNYRMVNEALLSRVALPSQNVHRINGVSAPQASAESYEAELKSFFGATAWPRFDLILLGMGDDGHTASLFPGSDALTENASWVVATRQPQSQQPRVTLTLPVLNHALRVMFVVTGEKKAAPLARVLQGDAAAEVLPAGKVRPAKGTCEWLIDRSAGSQL
jgi:6-phosphogluconolactonase